MKTIVYIKENNISVQNEKASLKSSHLESSGLTFCHNLVRGSSDHIRDYHSSPCGQSPSRPRARPGHPGSRDRGQGGTCKHHTPSATRAWRTAGRGGASRGVTRPYFSFSDSTSPCLLAKLSSLHEAITTTTPPTTTTMFTVGNQWKLKNRVERQLRPAFPSLTI